MKILVAGGGTAGHISPVLAVIASIRELNPDTEILFVCSGKDYEIELLKKSKIDFKIIQSGKYRRYGRGFIKEALDIKTQAQNVRDLGRTLRGYSYAKKIIKDFKPDVIFIKGGYVAVPVGRAASSLGIPYIIHESDSVMGKANTMLSKKASAIAVSFPKEAYKDVDSERIYFTGNPVRPEYYVAADRKVAHHKEQKPNILIIGGSQGAESINQTVFDNIELFTKNFDVLHITGEQGIERARYMRHKLPKELKKSYEPHGFLANEMVAAYNWSDIVVSRAGMNSLCEIAALSKPAIIIPLESSANNHQVKNAEFLAGHGAIRILRQQEVEGVRLVNDISKLWTDKSAMQYLSESIHKLFKPEASVNIAKIILAIATKKEGRS
jgi:UDP-N-acetylglucosamine--N-acetylmuramyl-(pentapeptide) pyrophosphoryl-undecaprenol N-acetylglucosamine transferase